MTNAGRLDFGKKLKTKVNRLGFFCFLFEVILTICLPQLQAHQISAVASKASFNRDGIYHFDLSLDVTGSPDPSMDQLISPEEAALTYLRDALEFRFDEVTFQPAFGPLQVVERKDPLDSKDDLVQLQTEATGKIPAGAKGFQVKLSPETDVALVMIVVKDGITQRRAQTIFAGEVSRPVDLGFVGQPLTDGDPFAAEKAAEKPVLSLTDGLRAGAAQMLAAGGHRVLLVVMMLLVASAAWQTGLQIIVFSVGSLAGHLLLRTTGWSMAHPTGEILLILALFAMAFDNVSRFGISWSRFVVVLLTGGLLGLASRDPAFESDWRLLLSYQGGVLLVGFLSALILWIVIGPFRSKPWYQERVVLPLSFGVVGMGLFWLAVGYFPGR